MFSQRKGLRLMTSNQTDFLEPSVKLCVFKARERIAFETSADDKHNYQKLNEFAISADMSKAFSAARCAFCSLLTYARAKPVCSTNECFAATRRAS